MGLAGGVSDRSAGWRGVGSSAAGQPSAPDLLSCWRRGARDRRFRYRRAVAGWGVRAGWVLTRGAELRLVIVVSVRSCVGRFVGLGRGGPWPGHPAAALTGLPRGWPGLVSRSAAR